jgi:catechol 2,3-dioxygenase-like lactoylglutathione lyase family enzyme
VRDGRCRRSPQNMSSAGMVTLFNMQHAETSGITGISAITLATRSMARAVQFYQALGFHLNYGGAAADFTSFHAGSGYLNLIAQPDRTWSWWGRVIIHVSDVDVLYARARAAGLQPTTAPEDAPWGERFFHITDPDGHELSFAKPLRS